jgi:hypothetical protein
MIGGNIIYGDPKYFYNTSYQYLPASEGSPTLKCVHVPPELDIDLKNDTTALESLLREKNVERSHFLACGDFAYRQQIGELESRFTNNTGLVVVPCMDHDLLLEAPGGLCFKENHKKIGPNDNLSDSFSVYCGTDYDEIRVDDSDNIRVHFGMAPNDGTGVVFHPEKLLNGSKSSDPYVTSFTYHASTNTWSKW